MPDGIPTAAKQKGRIYSFLLMWISCGGVLLAHDPSGMAGGFIIGGILGGIGALVVFGVAVNYALSKKETKVSDKVFIILGGIFGAVIVFFMILFLTSFFFIAFT